MNTLEELNDYGDDIVTATDDRAFSITYSDNTVQDYTVTITEGATHQVPVPIDISEIISASDVLFTIVFDWDGSSVLTGLDVLSYDADGSTLIAGLDQTGPVTWSKLITVISEWESYSLSTITPPDDTGSFGYTVTLSHPAVYGDDGSTLITGYSWHVTVNVNDLSEITQPAESSFDQATPYVLTQYPQITNVEDTSTVDIYSIVISGSSSGNLYLISAGGSGGTATWSSGAKTFTITGTRTQVNSRLANLTISPGTEQDADFLLHYELTNPSSYFTEITQWFRIGLVNNATLNLGVNRTYISNTYNILFTSNALQIDDSVVAADTYTVSLTLASAIGEIHTGDLSGWDSATKTFTYVGSKTQCNNKLNSLYFFPIANSSANTTLNYKQYRGDVIKADNTVNLTGTAGNKPAPVTYIIDQSYATFTTGSTWEATLDITYNQARYNFCDILIVGGGGQGGSYITGVNGGAGGGGGAGAVYAVSNTDLLRNNITFSGNKTLNIRPGSGGGRSGPQDTLAYIDTIDGLKPIGASSASGRASYIKLNSTELIRAIGGGGVNGLTAENGGSGAGASLKFNVNAGTTTRYLTDPGYGLNYFPYVVSSTGPDGSTIYTGWSSSPYPGIDGHQLGHNGGPCKNGQLGTVFRSGGGGGAGETGYYLGGGGITTGSGGNIDARGPGVLSSITGSSIEYGKGGQAVWRVLSNDSSISQVTTYGSGGNASGNYAGDNAQPGNNGVVILKFY